MIIDKKQYGSLICTLILIGVISVLFIVASLNVNAISTKYCHITMGDSASQVAESIDRQIEDISEEMRLMADIIGDSGSPDNDEVNEHMASFQRQSSLTAVGVLTSADKLLYAPVKYSVLGEELKFTDECRRGSYVSQVKTDKYGEKYIYFTRPVAFEGKTGAVLIGFLDLSQLAEDYGSIRILGDNAKLYVIDTSTGDFIIDTLRSEPGSVYDSSITSLPTKEGYDIDKAKADFKNNTSGYTAFVSSKDGESHYVSYEPVGVNKWMVMLTLKESSVMERALMIRQVLYVLATELVCVLLIYLLWVMWDVSRRNTIKENQISVMSKTVEIQQILAEAGKDRKLIEKALKQVCEALKGQAAFAMTLEGSNIDRFVGWTENPSLSKESPKGKSIYEAMPDCAPALLRGEAVRYKKGRDRIRELSSDAVGCALIMAVSDSGGRAMGVLGCLNMEDEFDNLYVFESLARGFIMAISNAVSYHTIERMGTMDSLTGLMNRNSYQRALESYDKSPREGEVCCVYADVNGLHEMNNHLGHSAGDKMLKDIGGAMADSFGAENCYRIGGDEFVALCCNMDRTEGEERLKKFKDLVSSMDYHVSAGLASGTPPLVIGELINKAEKNMYEAKAVYYKEKGDVSKARQMNMKLEKILMQKRDADGFLSIISSYFFGVYAVNLDRDEPRAIYMPEFFGGMLKEQGGKFSKALRMYIDKYVSPEDREAFIRFLDYDKIKKELEGGIIPERRYKRLDGMRVQVRVYKAPDSENGYETFWLFEEQKG